MLRLTTSCQAEEVVEVNRPKEMKEGIDPTFHNAREARRKAVTEAIDPNGSTHCLKILAEEQPGSYTAKYESRWKASSDKGTCL